MKSRYCWSRHKRNRRGRYAMSSLQNVTLFEADPRLGGHTDSHTVLLSDQVYSVDTGFVAFNEAQYPSFSAWLNGWV